MPIKDSKIKFQLGTFQNLQTLVEVSQLMQGQHQDVTWEQDGVRSLQVALNSQPSLGWDAGASIPKLESLDTLDLSIPHSAPVPRPTILHQRSLVVTHPYSSPADMPIQYVNLDGELLAVGGPTKRPRVKSREKSGEPGEVRPCKVCGERAGKHSYYGGQVSRVLAG